MTATPAEILDRVKEYAAIVRGEHPKWEGDRIMNGESYAFNIGFKDEHNDASEMIRSLGIAETQYALLTGLPVGSLRRLSAFIKRGIAAQTRHYTEPEEGRTA